MNARDTAALAASHAKLEAARDLVAKAQQGAGLTAGERDVIRFADGLLRQVETSVFERVAAALGELEREGARS